MPACVRVCMCVLEAWQLLWSRPYNENYGVCLICAQKQQYNVFLMGAQTRRAAHK